MVVYYRNKFLKFFIWELIIIALTIGEITFSAYQTDHLKSYPIDNLRSMEQILVWVKYGIWFGATIIFLGFEYCGYILAKAKGYNGFWGLLFSLPIFFILKDKGIDP